MPDRRDETFFELPDARELEDLDPDERVEAARGRAGEDARVAMWAD
ncbi:hypothetical protein [Brooklawnia cerclae]|uniref:Uncharacterized protein n=1 Tax=Brooklawnia cerclae TaxID=349934 RepID=A0ABX0SGF6_9ACTN|nr:hypothetical protein [Brooklawnia cerclae]